MNNKRFISIFIVFVTIISLFSINVKGKKEAFTLKELQSDFNQFKDIIEKNHPKLYANNEELNKLYETQYALLKDGMNSIDFYRILSPVLEKVGCGHSVMNFSEEDQAKLFKTNNYHLPFDIKVIDEKLLVRKSLNNSDIPEGSEIISINGKSSDEIINILLNNISADGSNKPYKYYVMSRWFGRVYFKYIDASEKFDITYIDPSEHKKVETTINSISRVVLDGVTDSLNGETTEITSSFEDDYAVLTLRTFEYYDYASNAKFKKYIDNFFKTIEEKKIPNLILDIQGNSGGDPYCTDYLLSYLIDKQYQYFQPNNVNFYEELVAKQKNQKNNYKGNVYTLIDGGNFSSSGHFISLLKYHKIGTLIGADTGSSYACTANVKIIELKNTKINVEMATSAFKTAVKGLEDSRTITPDFRVTPTINDYINNKNVARDFAIDLIKK